MAGLSVRLTARVGQLELDVDLATGPGTLVIVGPNGAGKSTLLSLILGVGRVSRGRISVDDVVLLDAEAGVSVPTEERRIGYVPQDYALFPHLTVRANVAFAVKAAFPKRTNGERDQLVESTLDDLGLVALSSAFPGSLSGGEKQRVALARAVAMKPRALLLDEPLAALDVHARKSVRAFLQEYLATVEVPTIVVTHDPTEARALGHSIAVLERGRVTQRGVWAELVARPESPFLGEFLRTRESASGV
ncbi:MAG: ATP-binding cassette domain-containing protein [Deltaproteobacteria bacterium]|nr:ATP-binding cassette domain-containing protein [Deltaproteobacteria bacterium]